MLKIVACLACLAFALVQASPVPPKDYSFFYNVDAPETGDKKYHSEAREGYVVSGNYAVSEPDRRTEFVYRRDSSGTFSPQTPLFNQQPVTNIQALQSQPIFVRPPTNPHGFNILSSHGYPGVYPHGYPNAYPFGLHYPSQYPYFTVSG